MFNTVLRGLYLVIRLPEVINVGSYEILAVCGEACKAEETEDGFFEVGHGVRWFVSQR